MRDPQQRRGFDRRLVILPAIALATAAAVLVPTELVLRARYPEQEIDRCIDQSGAMPHGRRNCTAFVKAAEGPWVENRYNACGYRSPASCGAAPPRSLRIALVGSSMGAGFFVPEPESISGRLAAGVQRACGRPTQTQNLALPDFPVTKVADSAREALALRPDVIVVTMTSYDVEKPSGGKAAAAGLSLKSVIAKAQDMLKGLAIAYKAKEVFLSSEKDYLKFIAAQHQSPEQQQASTADGFRILAGQIDAIQRAATDRGVPVVLAYMPNREEIARTRLTRGHQEPVSVALRRLAAERGIPYVDGLEAFPAEVPTAAFFYVANHHMNGTGDGYIARGLTKGLIASVPALRHCAAL